MFDNGEVKFMHSNLQVAIGLFFHPSIHPSTTSPYPIQGCVLTDFLLDKWEQDLGYIALLKLICNFIKTAYSRNNQRTILLLYFVATLVMKRQKEKKESHFGHQ